MKSPVRQLAITAISVALIAIAHPFSSAAQSSDTSAPAKNTAPSRGAMGTTFYTPAGIGPLWGRTIPGKPYSAEIVQEISQTLGDGTHISQTTHAHLYRDSEGRTRSEGLPSLVLDGNRIGPTVTIVDPVAGVRYMLDMQRQIARRYTMPAHGQLRPQENTASQNDGTDQPPAPQVRRAPRPTHTVQSSADASDGSPHPTISHVSLGKQTIEGIESVGLQTTRTIPEGAEGNDRVIEIVCENWDSPELHLTMISKCSDPVHGDNTRRVTSIDRSEPDASLFQVPPDFKIEDEMSQRVTAEPAPRPEQ